MGALLLFTSSTDGVGVGGGRRNAPASCSRAGQDEQNALLTQHRANIDAGERSAIFGLASFFEGIDLPGLIAVTL